MGGDDSSHLHWLLLLLFFLFSTYVSTRGSFISMFMSVHCIVISIRNNYGKYSFFTEEEKKRDSSLMIEMREK